MQFPFAGPTPQVSQMGLPHDMEQKRTPKDREMRDQQAWFGFKLQYELILHNDRINQNEKNTTL